MKETPLEWTARHLRGAAKTYAAKLLLGIDREIQDATRNLEHAAVAYALEVPSQPLSAKHATARVAELEAVLRENGATLEQGSQALAKAIHERGEALTRVAELEFALQDAFRLISDPHEPAPKAAVAACVSDALGVPIVELTARALRSASALASSGADSKERP